MNYIVQAVILVYFVGMFALGILGEQRTKNTADYYVAGRQVNGFFAGIVYTTSLVSAGALVGWVSQAWQWGIYFYLCRQRRHCSDLSMLVAAGAQTLYLLP